MAFSSIYKEYVKGAEMPVSGRKREDGALKRYESVEDSRAWSMDHSEKAKFIHDIIKQTPPLSDAVKCLNSLTKEELVDKIKILYQEMKVAAMRSQLFSAIFKHSNFRRKMLSSTKSTSFSKSHRKSLKT